MKSKTVSFRFPDDVIDGIEAEAQMTGRSKTDIVLNALAQAYGFQHHSASPITFEQLERQLNDLRAQVKSLSNESPVSNRQTNLRDDILRLTTGLNHLIARFEQIEEKLNTQLAAKGWKLN
ncbi:MAG: ribbon-helix-helix domain-containing protein [Pseudanabaenales cyanobacterium]|nr:ribbon-helix-helix domain-containing protein [Pseudanabaenales cyanobacterium]